MQAQRSSAYKRHKTRHRGITYRTRADGSKTYYVFAGGRQLAVSGGEKAAIAKQAELRGRVSRGERIAPATTRFSPVAEEWFASKRKLRASTRTRYRTALDLWLIPKLGHLKLAEITTDRIAGLIREMEASGNAGATIVANLRPLSGTFKFAQRRGLVSQNPIALLSPDERPTIARTEFRELGPAEVELLLRAAEGRDCFSLVTTAIFTGMRLGELLGLLWEDVDFANATIHVHRQWSREGHHAEPKTRAAHRRVVLAPDLLTFLRLHRARSRFSTESDFVFSSRAGTALGHRNVCRAFTAVAKKAGLAEVPKVTFHSLRHIFASSLIERGCSATVVAEQMGHSNSRITEERYIHLFNRLRTDEAVRSAIQEAMGLGNSLASTVGNWSERGARSQNEEGAPLHLVVPVGTR